MGLGLGLELGLGLGCGYLAHEVLDGARRAVRRVREVVRVADVCEAAVDEGEQQLGELCGAARGLVRVRVRVRVRVGVRGSG